MIGFSGLTIPSVISASAYEAADAVGSAFEVDLMAGQRGAVVYNTVLVEQDIQQPSIRLHLFTTGFSASVNGTPWQLGDGDEPNYIGYTDYIDWISAGAKSICQVPNPGLAMVSQDSGTRSLHGQFQALLAFTAASANTTPLQLNVMAIQD
jgi:hypothetical protein